VACVWRCGKIRGTVSVVPDRYLDVEPPPVSVTVPRGSTAGPSANFQAAYCAVASTATAGTGVAVKLPMTAIPAVPVLKPPACAPTTGRDSPPERPSHSRPKRSTSTL